MEGQPTPNYTHEHVQELQDKVRKLELQLSQQRSLGSKNGFVSEVRRVVPYTDDSELSIDGLIEVNTNNSSIRSWLLASSNSGKSNDVPSEELLAWVRNNSDSNPNQSFQSLRRKLYTDLYNAELEKRRNIDTRTFTRPKKRISRMPLEMMPEVVPSPNFQLTPPESPNPVPQAPSFATQLPNFPTKSVCGAVPENLDDQLLDNMTCSLYESMVGSLSVTDHEADVVEVTASDAVLPATAAAIAAAAEVLTASVSMATSIQKNSSIQKAPSVPELREEDEADSIEIKSIGRALSTSIQKTHSGSLATLYNSDLTVVNINTTFHQGSDPGLNMTAQNISAPNSRGSSPANSTFICSGRRGTITLGSRRGSSQLGSGDSDDQLSVASDCSASSGSRMLSVGEVQNLARLQEESLLVSTPKHIVSPKKPLMASDEKLSPILALQVRDRDSGSIRSNSPALSNDHLNRSPVSSKHSSRSASPSGIRPPSESRVGNGLSNLIRRDTFTASRDNINYTYTREPGTGNCLNREAYSANVNTDTFIRMPRPAQAPSEQPRGLRPPSVRPRASGLPVLAQRPGVGTGIPRPASRIPPPRTSCPRPISGPVPGPNTGSVPRFVTGPIYRNAQNQRPLSASSTVTTTRLSRRGKFPISVRGRK